MKILDRYIGSHFIGPFLTGVGAFTAILTGVSEVYWAVQQVVKEGVPGAVMLQVFLLHLPSLIALTLPMSTVFAALMVSGELSSHGEIVAVRAGGISTWRIALPVFVASALVALGTTAFNEALGPYANARAEALMRGVVMDKTDFQKPLLFRMPETGAVQRIVYADKVRPAEREMLNVTIIEYRDEIPREMIHAARAVWEGKDWRLLDVEHKQDTGSGYRESTVKELRYDLGRTLEQVAAKPWPRAESMTLKQILAAARDFPKNPPGGDTSRDWCHFMMQQFHLRLAMPWAAVCCAMLGFPLGLRPHRTTASVGFGISLAVVFVYYIAVNSLRAFGEQGAIEPLVAAWAPNIAVFGIGLGLMINASK
jgi:lipopolysaccharide export system permease protein